MVGAWLIEVKETAIRRENALKRSRENQVEVLEVED
jgi:hypothetical protein